jgi:aryl-alcohol dehydrogenase-like predicted oxidoreductase
MDYVNLGKTGLQVSRICLGCMTYGAPATGELKAGRHSWALDEDESKPFLRQALDLGINFFDTANIYSSGASEEVLGRFLKASVRREAVVIATKVHGFPARPSSSRSTRACVAWEPTTSICTRSTAGTTRRPSRRPWRPCTIW